MSIYSVIWLFWILTFCDTLTGNVASSRLNNIIFVISKSILVEIDTSFIFGGHFDFFLNAVRHIGKSYLSISLILKSKQWKTTFCLILNFKDNRSKIATLRVPQRKTNKMAAMMSRFRNVKIREKLTYKYLSDHLWKMSSKLIHPFGLYHCHQHTYTHTHTYIDTPSVRSQHIQSKWLNTKTHNLANLYSILYLSQWDRHFNSFW